VTNVLKTQTKGSYGKSAVDSLKKGEVLIGKKVTIRFQELTEKNVPRFPIVVCIRDYE